jgi:hypothetical protein
VKLHKIMVDFGYKMLPPAVPHADADDWTTVVNANRDAEEVFSKLSLREKLATNLHASLEAQYRTLMMLPQTLDIVKLQDSVARDCIRQAIELGHIAEQKHDGRIADVVRRIREIAEAE